MKPRLIQFALIAIMIVGAVITYVLKYQAEAAADRVAELRQAVSDEADALAYLKAEWSVLTQPSRLQELIELHAETLELKPIDPDQIAKFGDIPPRPVPPADGSTVAAGVSREQTGSIKP